MPPLEAATGLNAVQIVRGLAWIEQLGAVAGDLHTACRNVPGRTATWRLPESVTASDAAYAVVAR